MVVGLVLVAAVGAATPVGRAAGEQLLRFVGVEFSREPGPAPVETPRLPGEGRVSLEEARRDAGFPVLVPAALGAPEKVLISDKGRVVSLDYGALRLDEFDGHLNEILFQKFIGSDTEIYRKVKVNGVEAIWVSRPHVVWYVDRDGIERTASAHLSSTTLIWQSGNTALRLEGARNLRAAIDIAQSAR